MAIFKSRSENILMLRSRLPEVAVPQRVAILGPNLADQSKGDFHVHAIGCSDIARVKFLAGFTERHCAMEMDASCLTQIVDAVYPPEEFDCQPGEFLQDFHFAPCVHLPESEDSNA